MTKTGLFGWVALSGLIGFFGAGCGGKTAQTSGDDAAAGTRADGAGGAAADMARTPDGGHDEGAGPVDSRNGMDLAGEHGGGSGLQVDAGPDKELAFPASDVTLFGHASSPTNDPVTVQWTLASGPAGVKFSGPGTLATTVTFSAPGTYELRLAASDGAAQGTDTVTVTVKPASSQTAFYVDPSYQGGGSDGSAAAPWRAFEESNPDETEQWAAINRALGTNDVIVYFSARQAGADASEEILGSVHVQRADPSSHRLTLDGMSKYNTDDAAPSWADHGGSNKMRIKVSRGCCFSIGWYSKPDGDGKFDYVTLRGFEVTGSGARITWGGSFSVLEHIWSHDVTDLGATVQFDAAVTDAPACKDLGRSHDITIRNNVVERTIGEGMYIAGTYPAAYDGCPSYGNTHSDILIEGNLIRDPGKNGDQGDGIDLKSGLMNVTIRNNVIRSTRPANDARGIVSSGVFPPARSNYLFEGNVIIDAGENGIAFGDVNGVVIRNNVIVRSGGGGVAVYGPSKDVVLYNNTIALNQWGPAGYDTTDGPVGGFVLKNNLMFGNDPANMGETYPGNFDPSNINQQSTSGLVVDPVADDFHLLPDSPARDKGTDLSSTGFSWDFEGTARPKGGAWDIGAYEY